MFRTQYNRLKEVFKSNVGDGYQPTYKMRVHEDGKRELEKVGRIDLYAQIQSHKDSCDINYILERFARGDESALSKIQGVYGDFTQMPTNLAELQQRVVDAEALFYNLPVDVRAEFNHSPSEFYSAIGTDKFNKAVGITPQVDPVPQVDPQPVTPTPQVDPQPVVQKGEI